MDSDDDSEGGADHVVIQMRVYNSNSQPALESSADLNGNVQYSTGENENIAPSSSSAESGEGDGQMFPRSTSV